MTTLLELFNAGTDGSTVNTTDSPGLTSITIDSANGATAVYETASPLEGSLDAIFTSGTLGYVRAIQTPNVAVNQLWGDFVGAMSAAPSAAFLLCRIYGGPLRGSVRMNTDGTVSWRNGTTTVFTTTAAYAFNGTPFRISVDFNFGATSCTVGIFTGAAVYTSTATESQSGLANAGNAATMQWGFTDSANTANTLRVVRCGVSDTAAIVNPTPPPSADDTGWFIGSIIF